MSRSSRPTCVDRTGQMSTLSATARVLKLALCVALLGVSACESGPDIAASPSGPAVEAASQAVDEQSVLKEVELSWEAATARIEGSPVTNVVGYNIYYGTESRAYKKSPIQTGTETTFKLSLPAGKRYYFAVTARDAAGNESELSEEVVKDLR